MKTPKTDAEQAALAKGRCPDCGMDIVDLRGTNASPVTMRARGRCFGDAIGYECNKSARDQQAKAATWK